MVKNQKPKKKNKKPKNKNKQTGFTQKVVLLVNSGVNLNIGVDVYLPQYLTHSFSFGFPQIGRATTLVIKYQYSFSRKWTIRV